MKKSTIVITFGILIIVTALLGINNEKMYQKQKHFETTNEVIEQLKNKQITAIDEKGKISQTNDFKECFSERKRLTNLRFHYDKIEIQNIEELDEKQKQAMLKDYEESRKKFSKRRAITKEEPVRLNATMYDSYIDGGTIKYSNQKKISLDLVLIDEGEGLVIDYIKDLVHEEGNKDA